MKLKKMLVGCLCLMAMVSCGEGNQNVKEEATAEEGKNAVIENIMARRSIRKYKNEVVPREVLNQIMECGINAPNGQNKQSWEVRVVDNPQVMAEICNTLNAAYPKMENIASCFRGAPVMVFIARDKGYDFSAYDCGLMPSRSVWAPSAWAALCVLSTTVLLVLPFLSVWVSAKVMNSAFA